MLSLLIPGRGTIEIDTVVLDLNGTLAVDGELIEGVAEAVALLANDVRVVLLTADQRGKAAACAEALGIELIAIGTGGESERKLAALRALVAERAVVLGNGANDELALRAAAIGICVLGEEGTSAAAIAAADVVVRDIGAAFGLLANPTRLAATLRT